MQIRYLNPVIFGRARVASPRTAVGVLGFSPPQHSRVQIYHSARPPLTRPGSQSCTLTSIPSRNLWRPCVLFWCVSPIHQGSRPQPSRHAPQFQNVADARVTSSRRLNSTRSPFFLVRACAPRCHAHRPRVVDSQRIACWAPFSAPGSSSPDGALCGSIRRVRLHCRFIWWLAH